MFGPEYTKINTAFKRDERNLIVPGDWATPEITYLVDVQWRWTEKVDGTNIRLHWNGTRITIGGRTDNAQVPTFLIAALEYLRDPELWATAFPDSDDVTVYGEGYGPKIQKGGGYRDNVSVIVFDVRVGDWWLRPSDVADVASKLSLEVVPEVGVSSLTSAVGRFRDFSEVEMKSTVAASHGKTLLAEGIVGRPLVDLFDRKGNRILVKLKVKDFADLERRGQKVPT